MMDRYRDWRDGLEERQRRLLSGVWFLAIVLALAGPFYLVLGSGWDAPLLRRWTAAAAAVVLQGAGVGAAADGGRIVTDALIVDVTRDSTGWKSLIAFTALVLAARPDRRHAVRGLAIGVPVLAGANVLRLASMVWADIVLGVPYPVLHTVLWRWGLTLAVVAVWTAWLYHFWPFRGDIVRWPRR